jgi:hypothetical protein
MLTPQLLRYHTAVKQASGGGDLVVAVYTGSVAAAASAAVLLPKQLVLLMLSHCFAAISVDAGSCVRQHVCGTF